MPQEGRFRWLVPVVLVLIVVVVLVASWFYFFGTVSSAAKLVPADNMIYIRLDPDAGNIIPSEEGGYLEKLGSVFWQSFSTNNPFFSYEEDIKPWLGEEIVLTKASPDLLDPFVILAQVGDKSKALDTIKKLEDKFVGGEGEVQTERYKGVDLYIMEQPMPLAASYVKGYVVLSTSLPSVKQIIDVGNGDAPNLAGNKQFGKLTKNLGEKGDPAMLVSLRLQQSLNATTSSLGVSEQLFVKRLSLPEDMLLGLGLWPEDNGLSMRMYVGTARFESSKTIEPHMQTIVPRDAYGYYEGHDFVKLASEFIGGKVKLNPESVSWASGPYAVMLLPQTGEKKSAIAIVLEVEDEALAAAKLREAEPVMIAGLGGVGISGDTEFKDGELDGISTRYATFADGLRMDLNYVVKDNKIIFTTSLDALSQIFDTIEENTASVADEPTFASVLAATTTPQQMGFFYLNTGSLGSLLQDQNLPEVPEGESQGFLDQVFAPFSGMGVSTYNTGKGDFLANIFLRFAEQSE